MYRKKQELSTSEIEFAARRKYQLSRRGILYKQIVAETGVKIDAVSLAICGQKRSYVVEARLQVATGMPFRSLWGREAQKPTPRRREMLRRAGLVFCPQAPIEKPFRAASDCAGCAAKAECEFSAAAVAE